jgi:hypothetical protein
MMFLDRLKLSGITTKGKKSMQLEARRMHLSKGQCESDSNLPTYVSKWVCMSLSHGGVELNEMVQ